MNEENVTFDEFIKSDENRQRLSESLRIVWDDKVYPGCKSFKMVCNCYKVPEEILKEAMLRKKAGNESFLVQDSPMSIEKKLESLLRMYQSGYISSNSYVNQIEEIFRNPNSFICKYDIVSAIRSKNAKTTVSNNEFFYFFKETIPSADLDFIFEILESYKRILENRITIFSFFVGNDPTFESEFKKSIEEDKDAFHLISLYYSLLKIVDDKSLSKEDFRFYQNKLNKLIEDGLKQALIHTNALYD